MSKNATFTVSFSGQGLLLAITVVEGVNTYPKSTWYDYSNAMKQAVKQEQQIAESGYMDPKCIPSVMRAVKNQKSPRATDVHLDFSGSRGASKVKCTAGKRSKVFTFNHQREIDGDALLKLVKRIVKTVGQMGMSAVAV